MASSTSSHKSYPSYETVSKVHPVHRSVISGMDLFALSLLRLTSLACSMKESKVDRKGTFVTCQNVSDGWCWNVKNVWNTAAKDVTMSQFILLALILVIFACAFGFMVYRDAGRRAKEKRRNQYNDRV